MRRKLFVAAVVLQFVVLVGWAGGFEWALATATVVRLQVAPVEQRDLLRGESLVLRYHISTLPAELFTPPLSVGNHQGERAYVVLAPGARVWTAVAASLTREHLRVG